MQPFHRGPYWGNGGLPQKGATNGGAHRATSHAHVHICSEYGGSSGQKQEYCVGFFRGKTQTHKHTDAHSAAMQETWNLDGCEKFVYICFKPRHL